MTGALIDALTSVDPTVTADELGDALWLLSKVYPEPPPAADPHTPPTTVPTRPPLATTAPRPPDRLPPPTPVPLPDPEPPAPEPAVEWHLPTYDRLLDAPSRIATRSPGVPALPGTLALARALRPLYRRMPSRTAEVLDEDATVRQAADADLWVPVSRPAPDRWLELALVVDDSASMVIWQRTVAELREFLTRMGAFRDVRTWRCDSDLRTADRLTVQPEAVGGRGAGRDARELVDPSGRRVVLVVSDCIGQAWATGEMSRVLRLWGTGGPVAVVQPLPQRLWSACGPAFHTVRLEARRPAAPNTELRVSTEADSVPPGIPVPVLELEARWFDAWAALVARTGPPRMLGAAIFTGTAAGRQSAVPPAGQDPEELLARYASFASTEALRLARCLAAAPLSLPVMRLVQQAMLPESRPSVLAEVFLSGLLRQRVPAVDRRQDVDEVEYEFLPGVRDRLLDALPRHEKLAVLARVSDFVAQRLGSPMDFRAFLAAEDSAAAVLEHDQPFAVVALSVLQHLGGRYTDAAAVLERKALRPRTSPPDPASSDASIAPPRVKMSDTAENRGESAEDSPTANVTAANTPGDREVVTTTSQPITVHERPTDVVSQPKVFGNVPFRNAHFTGRARMLERLRDQLQRATTNSTLSLHAVHGIGGVGKTQLAIEYAYRYAPQYDLVWWVPAESVTTVRASLAELAEALKLPVSEDMSQTVSNVLAALHAGRPYRRWLLVFDNADRPEDLRVYLPPLPLGHVLITSRNPMWAEVAVQVEVDVFTREESVDLLQRRGSGISAADAAALAEKLGDLPLALDQAAAWQSDTGMPVRDMLRLLDERMSQLFDDNPMSQPQSVMATWDLAFGRLQEQSPGAAQLLELCSFFGSEPISVPLLWAGRNAELPNPVALVLRDDIRLRRAIRNIGRYALAKIDPSRDQIEIHRLIQSVLRERMSAEKRETTLDAVHNLLGHANPGNPDDPKNWERHAELLPHVTPSDVMDAKADIARRVALDQIRYRYVRGDYVRGRSLGEAVVERWRETLGQDHELTLIAQRHLGNTLRDLGERDHAAALNQDTLERLRAVFGDEHEHTLATANSVGADLRLRGEFTQAKELDEETLGRSTRVFGPDDDNTLRVSHNLAVDLRLLGHFEEALELDERTLELRTAIHGSDAPETLHTLTNVARDQFDAGNYRKARTLLAEALPRIRRHGEDTREVIFARRVLAMTLRRLGAYAQAREAAEELYDGVRRIYREDHEHTLSAMITFACSLLAVGERAQARSVTDQALGRYRRTFGVEHPFTLAAAVNLAMMMRAGDEFGTARELDERTVEVLTRVVGEEHPYTVTAMLNLGNDYAAAHELQRARGLSERAHAISRRVRGENHPHTLGCALNYSLDLRAAGEHGQAQALFEEVQIRLRRVLGEDHPDTRSAAEGRRAERDIEVPAA
jgi:tetratricopeptide (TPR) repeat protein